MGGRGARLCSVCGVRSDPLPPREAAGPRALPPRRPPPRLRPPPPRTDRRGAQAGGGGAGGRGPAASRRRGCPGRCAALTTLRFTWKLCEGAGGRPGGWNVRGGCWLAVTATARRATACDRIRQRPGRVQPAGRPRGCPGRRGQCLLRGSAREVDSVVAVSSLPAGAAVEGSGQVPTPTGSGFCLETGKWELCGAVTRAVAWRCPGQCPRWSCRTGAWAGGGRAGSRARQLPTR